jgi:hypothetical protein
VTAPSHFFFPTKYTYPFTIYKAIFEEKLFLHVEFIGEIIEGLAVLGYFISFITNYDDYFVLKIISVSLVGLFIIFFSYAEIMIIIHKKDFVPQKKNQAEKSINNFNNESRGIIVFKF